MYSDSELDQRFVEKYKRKNIHRWRKTTYGIKLTMVHFCEIFFIDKLGLYVTSQAI